ncbi:MAG: Fur family transcriptional regulator [Leucobacter sp.]
MTQGLGAGIAVEGTPLSERLNAVGLRSTAPRRAVMEVLSRGGHWNASDVFDAVAKDLDGTSLQAVYGVLAALSEVGLVRKIEPPNSPALYERRVNDNHHHLVCTECGEIKDVACAVGEAPCLAASETHDYTIQVAEVTYHGICPACMNDNRSE